MISTTQLPTNPKPKWQIAKGQTNKTLKVSVRFGRPSQNCQNFGLCRIEQFKQGDELPRSDFAVAVISKNKNGHLVLQFDKRTMTKNTIKKHFAHLRFIIEEDVRLRPSIAKVIGWKRTGIKRGQYPIQAIDNWLKLTLTKAQI